MVVQERDEALISERAKQMDTLDEIEARAKRGQWRELHAAESDVDACALLILFAWPFVLGAQMTRGEAELFAHAAEDILALVKRVRELESASRLGDPVW